MDRKFTFLILFILLCSLLQAQDKWKTVTDEKSGRQMLIGEISREALKDTSFSWWFDSEYEGYAVKSKELEGVEDRIKDYDITIVMGTWCSDSRREVPRFLKILDTLKYPEGKLKILSVDRKRKALNSEADSMKIELVPTFILSKGGKESGRITEAPVETLETDLNNIISGKTDNNEKKE